MVMDETFRSLTGTMTILAPIMGVAMVQVLVIILPAVPIIPMTARGLLVMRTLRVHSVTQSILRTITPLHKISTVMTQRTWSLRKSESSLLIHMLHPMTQETRGIAPVGFQSLTDAIPHTLLLTSPLHRK